MEVAVKLLIKNATASNATYTVCINVTKIILNVRMGYIYRKPFGIGISIGIGIGNRIGKKKKGVTKLHKIMHLSSSDPYPSPQRRGSTHTAMFSRQLSSLKSDDVILPGVGKTDAFGSKDNNDNSSPSIKIAAKPTTGGLAAKLRPTGRLKSVVRKISVVNELSKMKDVNDDRKLVHGDVLPPPKCLGKYFQQAKKEERRYRLDESQRK